MGVVYVHPKLRGENFCRQCSNNKHLCKVSHCYMYTHVYGMSRTIVTLYLTGLFLDKSKGLTDLLEAAKIYK